MADKKARWQQRFESFDKAYLRFAEAVSWDVEGATDASSSIVNAAGGDKNILKETLVKRFELAFKLARNCKPPQKADRLVNEVGMSHLPASRGKDRTSRLA